MTLRIQELVSGGATRWYSWPSVNIFSYLCTGSGSQGCQAWFGASGGTGGSTARHTLVSYSYTPLRASITPSSTPTPAVTPSNTPSTSLSSSITASSSATATVSQSVASGTPSSSETPSSSSTASQTPSASNTPNSLSPSPPLSPSVTNTRSSTATPLPTSTPSLWAAVGNTYFVGARGTLPAVVTPPLGFQTGALWHPYPLLTDEFRMRVVLRIDSLGAAGMIADGLALVWHRDPRERAAIGQTGGMVGVGATTGTGIANAAALRFDTYDGTNSRGSLDFYANAGGNLPNSGQYDLTGRVTLWSGNDIEVNITYSRTTGVLATVLTEQWPEGGAPSYSYSWSGVNLPQSLGCGTASPVGTCPAWVGMTAATGGRWARQIMRAFSYENLQPSPSGTPSNSASTSTTGSNTPSASITPSITPSASTTQINSGTPTPSNTPSSSVTPSGTALPSGTPSSSQTRSQTPSTTGTPTPSSTPRFIVNGDARATGGLPPLTLNRALVWSVGSAFWGAPFIADGFRVTFTIRGLVTVGVSPADGMTFAIQRDPRGAAASGGMGECSAVRVRGRSFTG